MLGLDVGEVGLRDQPFRENVPGHDPQRIFEGLGGTSDLLQLLQNR